MGASAAKPEGAASGASGGAESGSAVLSNTPKERSLKLKNRRASKSSNPSPSPARQKKQDGSSEAPSEDQASKQGENGASDKQEVEQEGMTQQKSLDGGGGGGGREESEEELTEPPEMSEGQKDLIKESWKALEANVAKVGVVIFIKLFETHPDVQEVFMPFRGIALEDIKHSKQLRAHALRVMGFVNKAVARLDQPDKLMPLLKECGKSHYYYGASVKYIDLVGPQFIASIRPSMEEEERWSEDTEEAWVLLFQHISFQMKTSIKNEACQ